MMKKAICHASADADEAVVEARMRDRGRVLLADQVEDEIQRRQKQNAPDGGNVKKTGFRQISRRSGRLVGQEGDLIVRIQPRRRRRSRMPPLPGQTRSSWTSRCRESRHAGDAGGSAASQPLPPAGDGGARLQWDIGTPCRGRNRSHTAGSLRRVTLPRAPAGWGLIAGSCTFTCSRASMDAQSYPVSHQERGSAPEGIA